MIRGPRRITRGPISHHVTNDFCRFVDAHAFIFKRFREVQVRSMTLDGACGISSFTRQGLVS